MQRTTDHSAVQAFPQQAGTGPGTEAITPEEQLSIYTLATLEWLEARAKWHDAKAVMQQALAQAHRADPYLTAENRTALSAAAEQLGSQATDDAFENRRRAAALRGECGIGAPSTAEAVAQAVIVIDITHDRIKFNVGLLMGGHQHVSREYRRTARGTWQILGADFIEAEDRIGVELAEYVDELDLPSRVAEMLPRRPSSSEAAAQAAAEVRRG